ncbi:MAG: hypothetical protein PS018_18705 [bacterium]|nr:hypothetical protein [bacterium]
MSCIIIPEAIEAAKIAQLPAQALRLTHLADAHIQAGRMHDARDYMVEAQRCMDRFLSQSSALVSYPDATMPVGVGAASPAGAVSVKREGDAVDASGRMVWP